MLVASRIAYWTLSYVGLVTLMKLMKLATVHTVKLITVSGSVSGTLGKCKTLFVPCFERYISVLKGQ